MKSLSLAVSILALSVVAASAADLAARPYTKAPVAVVSPVYNWTGFYVGVHGGGDWFNKDWSTSTSNIAGCVGPCGESVGGHNGSSWLVGGQAGFNYQIASWVIGVEAQASWTDLNGQNLFTQPTLAANGFIGHSKTDGLGTLAVRFGYAVDRTLIFVKGGGAWARDRFLVSLNLFPEGAQAATDDRYGWMVGVGLEYALAGNWSVKAEYNHLDFGTRTETLNPLPTCGCVAFQYDVRQTIDLVKAGVNYRFNWNGPVVAKY
jgi:outer membrane immunogenic protein